MSLLERLMAKPQPRTDKDVIVGTAFAGVPVIDKTQGVNRGEMLKSFAQFTRVMKRERAVLLTGEEPEPSVDKTRDAPDAAAPAPSVTGVRRTKRKLVLADGVEAKSEARVTRARARRGKGVADIGPLSMIKIGSTAIGERKRPSEPLVEVRASSYYMDNRQIFTSFIASLFGPYKEKLGASAGAVTCKTSGQREQSLFTHQEIVRDYINMYTPYRGVLLYHGLGSGKTCASVAIAEGLKNNKKVYIMTPASLQANYRADLKKCGDPLYRKNQFWEFVKITGPDDKLVDVLSAALTLPMEWIRRNKGAWMVNVKNAGNFGTLDAAQKASLDTQLDEMVNQKYRFLNYNGMRSSHLAALSENHTKNPFDNSVVVIDEAHNFVSRIVNKLRKPDSLSARLYQYMMAADGARIVMLSGTPIINYPNEIAVMFNMLRGMIKTWYFKLSVATQRKISEATLRDVFKKFGLLDYLEYRPTSTTLVVTRNPFGFYSVDSRSTYKGVALGERGDVDDDSFVAIITSLLQKNNIKITPSATRVEMYKALPDTLDGFSDYFIEPNTGDMKNEGLFKRRVLGLTSYYRSAQEQLMPSFEKSKDFHLIKVPMSEFQFGVYEEARIQERKLEKNNARKKKAKKGGDDIYQETVSTYRIFSRAFCNFVFPRPEIVRPMPREGLDIEAILEQTADEDLLDAATVEERLQNVDGLHTADDAAALKEAEGAQDASYEKRIQIALKQLENNSATYLSPEGLETYSPKFLAMLDNIQDPDNKGLHLVYSQFRTLEGIGIFAMVLRANGFGRFGVKKDSAGAWSLDTKPEDAGKPMYALYTGTETQEEKEIIRNIFNGNWELIPTNLADELAKVSSNNLYGEIIRVLMITASGAEGINLENVRFVHLTEPYWHPVRLEQVIGRARRICSHQHLPEALRTVTAFLYIMTFSEEQLASDQSIELRLQDKSRLDKVTPLTTDQSLYEIATIKENINRQILTSVKESAIDCSLHNKKGSKEKLKCFTFGRASSSRFAFTPSISDEEADTVADINRTVLKVRAVSVTIDGVKYAYNKGNGDVYDFDSYTRGDPLTVGKLEVQGKKYVFTKV